MEKADRDRFILALFFAAAWLTSAGICLDGLLMEHHDWGMFKKTFIALGTGYQAIIGVLIIIANKPANWGMHSYKRVSRPLGFGLLGIAEFFYSPNTLKLTFQPLVADLEHEYNEALFQGRKWKAKWIRARYGWAFFKTIFLSGAVSLIKQAVAIWKATK